MVVLIMQDGEQIYKDTISSYIQDGKVLLTKHGTSISVKTHATTAPRLWIEETTLKCSNAMGINKDNLFNHNNKSIIMVD